jgi:protein phosphatase
MLVDVALGVFAVADGMGGHNAGEVASQLAMEALHTFLQRSHQDPDHTWPFGVETGLDFNGNRLRTAIKLANRRVFRESESRVQYSGMGTTIAAMVIDGTCGVLSGIGDSRIYLVRRSGIERLTRDHTWIEMLRAQNPDIDPESLSKHPMRHVLTTVLGAQDDVDATVLARPVVAGERFVLCTDGVHGALAEEEIRRVVWSAPDFQAAADRLVEEALDRDGQDNLTAVVACVR